MDFNILQAKRFQVPIRVIHHFYETICFIMNCFYLYRYIFCLLWCIYGSYSVKKCMKHRQLKDMYKV